LHRRIQNAQSMSNKKDYLLLLIVAGAALWAALVFLKSKTGNETVLENPVASTESLPAQNQSGTPAPALAASNPTSRTPVANVVFGPHLREIGQCLQISNGLNDTAKPTFDDLQTSLQPAMGELLGSASDWKNIHVTLPNGEKRRIRIEIEGSGEEAVRRHLQYFSVDTEDLPVPIPLPKEQSTNPSDTFLAGLEKEGQVTLREEARRGVYDNGAELFYVERNGTLSEIEMGYNGKSVRCQDLDTTQGNCRCF
jgi:hypothetical protein